MLPENTRDSGNGNFDCARLALQRALVNTVRNPHCFSEAKILNIKIVEVHQNAVQTKKAENQLAVTRMNTTTLPSHIFFFYRLRNNFILRQNPDGPTIRTILERLELLNSVCDGRSDPKSFSFSERLCRSPGRLNLNTEP